MSFITFSHQLGPSVAGLHLSHVYYALEIFDPAIMLNANQPYRYQVEALGLQSCNGPCSVQLALVGKSLVVVWQNLL
jgi:hypothetical protein